MYQLYERVQKSKEYMYGSKPIEQDKNPFLEGPCFLSIAAMDKNDKSVFGVTKEAMKMARLRVRGSKNAGFNLKDFPVKFLSMKLEKGKNALNNEQSIEIFTNTYLVPLISKNGEKIELNQAMKNIRNVNIMSYCDGTLTVQMIENILIDKMKSIGYTDLECEKIQSQMCMFPIATNRLEGKQKSTCIAFKDINDIEVYDEINDKYGEEVRQTPIGEKLIKLSKNELVYLADGTGEHELKEYQETGKVFQVCLSSVITRAIQNSIENANSNDLIPINVELLTQDLEKIMQQAQQGISKDDLMQHLDEDLEYAGARKLSEYEIELLDQIDEIYDNQIKITKQLSSTEQEYLKQKEQLIATNDSIKQNCTGITAKKIFITAQNYQAENAEEILNAPSDREIISKFERTPNLHEQKAQRLQDSVEISKMLSKQIQEINQEKIKE